MAPIDRMACTRLETEHVSPFNDITIPPSANHTTSSVHNYGKWLKAKLKHGINQLFSTDNQLKLSHGIDSKPADSEKKINWLVPLPS